MEERKKDAGKLCESNLGDFFKRQKRGFFIFSSFRAYLFSFVRHTQKTVKEREEKESAYRNLFGATDDG